MSNRTTLPHAVRQHILARENQQRWEREKYENNEPFLPLALEPREEQELLERSLNEIRTDQIACPCTCPCQPKPATFRYVKPAAPVATILTHKFHKEQIWFYCRLDTKRANPEFRRQCQVSVDMRVEYLERLKIQGRVLRENECWSAEDEARVRAAVYPALTTKQLKINEQVRNCQDTNEWDVHTNNGAAMKVIKAKKSDMNLDGPVVVEEGLEYYDVESILGASLDRGKIWYLIKWQGWDSSHNSWQPATALKGVHHELRDFRKEYGTPTYHNWKILTPAGVDFERWEKIKAAAEAERSSRSTHSVTPLHVIQLKGQGSRSTTPNSSSSLSSSSSSFNPKKRGRFKKETSRDATPSSSSSISLGKDATPTSSGEKRRSSEVTPSWSPLAPPSTASSLSGKEATPSAASGSSEEEAAGPSSNPFDLSNPGKDEYVVQKIHGAIWATGTSKIWLLIRWEGYPMEECTWGLESSFRGGCVMADEFYQRMGKPDWNKPKILDAEGLAFVKMVEAEEARKKRKKSRN